MNELWQTITGGLAVAAITGLSMIAYRHPAGYRRLYLPLAGIVFGIWLAWLIYYLGYTVGFSHATSQSFDLNPDKIIKTPSLEKTPWLPFVIPAVAYAYLTFLRFLPDLLKSDSRDQSEE